MKMLRSLLSFFIVALIRDGSCTPTRIIHDDNTRDEPTPALSSWDLWDTYGGKFSSHIPDMYMRPTIGQLKNFGFRYPFNKFRVETPLKYGHQQNLYRIWLKCDHLEDMKKQRVLLSPDDTVRCRRTTREWLLQEPLYVDEPGWLPLSEKIGDVENRRIDDEDPFIVARGKRSSSNKKVNSVMESNKRMKREVSRRKRELNNDDNFYSYSFNSNNENGYLQPRDKHSDIMDILSEPFFISRGKKNYDKKSDIQDVLSYVDTIDFNSSTKSRPIRDRRGDIFEQLLKEQDPFYIARGRRGTNDLKPMVFKNQN